MGGTPSAYLPLAAAMMANASHREPLSSLCASTLLGGAPGGGGMSVLGKGVSTVQGSAV